VGYTTVQAARLTGCAPEQLEAWRSVEVVVPRGADGRYGTDDLVALRVTAALLDAGAGMRAVRAAVEALPAGLHAAAATRLVVASDRAVVCADEAELAAASAADPVVLVVALGPFVDAVRREELAFDADRRAFVDDLREAAPPAP